MCHKHPVFKCNSQVISPDGEAEFLEILAGVLAPYLFVIVSDYAESHHKEY